MPGFLLADSGFVTGGWALDFAWVAIYIKEYKLYQQCHIF